MSRRALKPRVALIPVSGLWLRAHIGVLRLVEAKRRLSALAHHPLDATRCDGPADLVSTAGWAAEIALDDVTTDAAGVRLWWLPLARRPFAIQLGHACASNRLGRRRGKRASAVRCASPANRYHDRASRGRHRLHFQETRPGPARKPERPNQPSTGARSDCHTGPAVLHTAKVLVTPGRRRGRAAAAHPGQGSLSTLRWHFC